MSRSNSCNLTLEMTRHLPVGFSSITLKTRRSSVFISQLGDFQRPVIIGLLLVLHLLAIGTGTLVLMQLKQFAIHSSLLAATVHK